MIFRHSAAAILFILLAIAMTWPLAAAIDRGVSDPGDPFINTWILDWNHHALLHRPLSLFHANVFHPAKYTLAFSEHLFSLAVLLVPLRALGVPPLVAHNLAVIGGFAFSGYAAWLLGWRITRSFAAGMAAGVFFAFVPFRFTHLSHVQHLWHGWLPLMLAALLAWRERPTWPRAALVAAAFLMNGLTNLHTLLFGGVAILATLPFMPRRELPKLVAALAIASLLLVPFLYPYFAVSKLYGMERSAAEVERYSAEWRDWLNPGTRNRLYASWADREVDPERYLFPGVLAIVVALVGAARQSESRGIALVWIAIGVAGSLGLHTLFYRLLYEFVPGFSGIRVPARFAAVAYVGIAMLVAAGVAMLARKSRVAAALVPLAFLVELRAAPIRWHMTVPETPEVYRWLASAPVRGAIAELPIDHPTEYVAMLRATEHHKPVVNGISGFAPPGYLALDAAEDALDDRLIGELRRAGAEFVIVHADWLGARGEAYRAWLRREIERGNLSFVRRFDHGIDGDWVFSLSSGGRRSAPELERFLAGLPTRNDGTFGILDYPRPNERLTDRALFSGWALSPHGIRKVDLLLDGGTERLPTTLVAEPALHAKFPWYPKTEKPRFVAPFTARPPGVRRDTDVQVEITDGRGEVTILEGRWIEWP